MFDGEPVSFDEIFEFYDEALRNAISKSVAACYDGCHKIYLLSDEEEQEQSIRSGYFVVPNLNPDTTLTLIREWYENSCGLEFVTRILPVEGNYKSENDRYVRVISQGLDEM